MTTVPNVRKVFAFVLVFRSVSVKHETEPYLDLIKRSIEEDSSTEGFSIYKDTSVFFLSFPLKDASGKNIGGVSILRHTRFMEQETKDTKWMIFLIVLLLVRGTVGVVFLIVRQSIHRPMSALLDGIRSMTQGNFAIWFYRMAGRKLMWFCQEPLMAFAKTIDFWTMNLVGLLVSFSNHPTETLSAQKRELKLMVNRFLRLTEGVEQHVPLMSRGQENPASRRELPTVTLGASILIILLLFSIYLAFYLAISD